MIPILYANTETNFTSNGLGRLADCISCRVTEERNGIYECEFQYPVTGEMFKEILGIPTPNNIYTGTRRFSGTAWGNIEYWTQDGEYNGFTVMKRSDAYYGIGQQIHASIGETYTYSAYVKRTSASRLIFLATPTGITYTDADQRDITGDIPADTWTRIVVTFTVIGDPGDGGLMPRIENMTYRDQYSMCGIKLERGDHATEWTPAPSDADQQASHGRIIGVAHDDNHDIQPFDIYAWSAPINGIVTFYAHHISYRLGNIILSPYTATSCAQALAAMETNSYNPNPFTFWTDKSVNANFAISVPTQCKSILGGVQGSILDVYGTGEYEWDKFAVKLHLHRGADHGVSIRYGVNMTAITQERDVSGKYNAIAPYWKSQEGDEVVYLPEGYVTASGQSNAVPVAIDFTQDFEEQPTVAELRAKAQSRLTNDTWSPDENIKVSFVNLTDTEDYKHVAALQRVKLCDRVSVYDADLCVNAVSAQVIRVVYNTLLDRYDEIELGTAQASLAQTIIGDVGEQIGGLPTKGYLDDAIRHAIDLISGGTGGYVVISQGPNGQPNEILIMDTPSAETAVNVIRINNAGISFSQSGYSGPFTTAWTIDGAFVADFITAGRLDANIIRTGVITGNVGKSSWNLDTGELNISITTAGGQEVYLSTLMWVDADGLHVGTGTDSSTTALVAHDGFKVIDSGGEVTAWLGSRMQTLGTLVIRQTADGGHAFTSMTQERGD